MKFKDKGEKLAAEYLREKGYKIIDNNFRGRYFEIDLIARREDVIIFVEVKRRTSTSFMKAISGVDRNKKRNIIRGAKLYLQRNNLYGRSNVRFDVISVEGSEEGVEHYQDAFRVE